MNNSGSRGSGFFIDANEMQFYSDSNCKKKVGTLKKPDHMNDHGAATCFRQSDYGGGPWGIMRRKAV